MIEAQPDRPAMPVGYGIVRDRPDSMVDWADVRERLAAARNYWVSTTRPDGRPHAMPVWGLWLDDTFVFATDPASRKARNLAANDEAVVHLESGDEVVILEGRLAPVHDAAILARFADSYHAKYAFRPETTGDVLVLALQPRTAFAWLEKDFPSSATRWRFA